MSGAERCRCRFLSIGVRKSDQADRRRTGADRDRHLVSGFPFRGKWRPPTAAIDTTGASLLVAWVAVDGADPAAPTNTP